MGPPPDGHRLSLSGIYASAAAANGSAVRRSEVFGRESGIRCLGSAEGTVAHLGLCLIAIAAGQLPLALHSY